MQCLCITDHVTTSPIRYVLSLQRPSLDMYMADYLEVSQISQIPPFYPGESSLLLGTVPDSMDTHLVTLATFPS